MKFDIMCLQQTERLSYVYAGQTLLIFMTKKIYVNKFLVTFFFSYKLYLSCSLATSPHIVNYTT
jgi:hypothetical protein